MPEAADDELSPAADACARVLRRLGLSAPPVTPEMVLAELKVQVKAVPAFDVARLNREQVRIFGSVRAILAVEERAIYLNPDVASRQVPWAIYHEVGHDAIEWHRDFLYLDNMYSLSPKAREVMEREANEFAGHLQFLGTRFADDARELPYGLKSAILLADRYEASYEAAIRRYVETRACACVCEVFQIVPADEGVRTLKLKYFVRPRSPGVRLRPDDPIGTKLPLNHPVVELLNGGKLDGLAIMEATRYDPVQRTAYLEQAFSNSYQVFVLSRPADVRQGMARKY